MRLALIAVAALLAACAERPTVTLEPGPFMVAAYGDSTQRAQGDPHAASRGGWVIQNRGVSGATSSQLFDGKDGLNKTWREEMADTSAIVIVLNHGLNDGALKNEEYRKLLEKTIDIARDYGKFVVLEQPNNAVEHQWFDVPKFHARVQAMKEVAQEREVFFCSQPDVPLLDAVHPTPEGLAIKATRLAECLAEVEIILRSPS